MIAELLLKIQNGKDGTDDKLENYSYYNNVM